MRKRCGSLAMTKTGLSSSRKDGVSGSHHLSRTPGRYPREDIDGMKNKRCMYVAQQNCKQKMNRGSLHCSSIPKIWKATFTPIFSPHPCPALSLNYSHHWGYQFSTSPYLKSDSTLSIRNRHFQKSNDIDLEVKKFKKQYNFRLSTL